MTVPQLVESTGVVSTASGGMVPIRDALRMAEHAINHRHHLGDLLAAALAHDRARRETELRERRRRWLRDEAGEAGGGDGPL
ncbi:hypothetical protein ACWDTG_26225 [Rhodococcus zopfii]|uniref:hypothetical protein n=1 Tax=Rhodococcus zopfii TaxID=43772 RepID=UPI001F0E2EB3|nr:hypothetical protein [Rhodococcus zopfii]